jgi:uncharacterized protein DUF3618
MSDKRERLTMPGEGPTDEDLRQDAELTRQELAQTVAALAEKADIKARVHDKADELRERGDELAEKLPEPVRPVVTTATRKPWIPVAALLASVLVLRRLRKRRKS